MSYPKLGMPYSDVAKRVKRIQSYAGGNEQAKANLLRSLKNQCRLAEGERALKELENECSHLKEKRSFLTGAGTKQVGIGSGKRLGEGRWKYDNGKWEKIDG